MVKIQNKWGICQSVNQTSLHKNRTLSQTTTLWKYAPQWNLYFTARGPGCETVGVKWKLHCMADEEFLSMTSRSPPAEVTAENDDVTATAWRRRDQGTRRRCPGRWGRFSSTPPPPWRVHNRRGSAGTDPTPWNPRSILRHRSPETPANGRLRLCIRFIIDIWAGGTSYRNRKISLDLWRTREKHTTRTRKFKHSINSK